MLKTQIRKLSKEEQSRLAKQIARRHPEAVLSRFSPELENMVGELLADLKNNPKKSFSITQNFYNNSVQYGGNWIGKLIWDHRENPDRQIEILEGILNA